MDNGMELRVKDYCAFCPDFEADVDKVDITVLADHTQATAEPMEAVMKQTRLRISTKILHR